MLCIIALQHVSVIADGIVIVVLLTTGFHGPGMVCEPREGTLQTCVLVYEKAVTMTVTRQPFDSGRTN